jgi:hypothetical protein
MGYNIITDPTATAGTTLEQWKNTYMDRNVEIIHDQTMMTLATPDDSIMVVGPPRLADAKSEDKMFYTVGLVSNITYNESSIVQPMKGIGSRRHIFSRTNAPVQGSIGRLVVLGPNLYRALYAMADVNAFTAPKDTQLSKTNKDVDSWFANLEENLFRIPFGLGIIYMSPANGADSSKTAIGAEYIECCALVNRNVGMQAGQAMIMEQVSFLADRVIPWAAQCGKNEFQAANPAGDLFS